MSSLTEKLAENARRAGIASVYGDPIELDGVTIVPVALSYYGFGAGDEGGDKPDTERAGGGGGGGASVPIGAYVRDADGVRFQPNIVSLLAVAIPFVWVTGRAWSRVIRALKK
jgi:uncharacterized spore protein YtfJ